MIKKYIYNNVEYLSEQAVRNAIMKSERKIFGRAPVENLVDFWSSFGVTYIEEEEPIEVLKALKSLEIKQSFLQWRNNKATLISSLGFKIDSNERANTDVSGLLIAHEDNQDALITFRDADNEFHALTYSQVKTLQKEIIENGNHAYIQKWALDAQVDNATTKDEIEAVEIKFEGKNFSKE